MGRPERVDRDRFFDRSPDLFCVVGFDGYLRDVNAAWEPVLGFSAEQLKARPFLSFVHPDDRDTAAERFGELTTGLAATRFEARLVSRDGPFRWLDWNASAIPSDGLIFATARDVTEQRHREDAVRESEAGFRLVADALERQAWTLREQGQLLDLAHDSITVRDMEDRILFWNLGAEETYGWTRRDAIGRSYHELLRTEFPVPQERIHEELLRSGRWEGELVHRRRDGVAVVVDSRWALDRHETGRARVILEINNDVTERRRAEEALRDSMARFKAIFDDAPVGISLGDLQGRVIETNRVLQELLGFSADELRGKGIPELTHPLDADRELELHRELVEGIRERYQIEKRYVRKDGGALWARLTGSLVRGQDGNPRYVIGMAEDIRLALVDELTGLSNRRAFFTVAQHHITLARRGSRPLALLFVDVNGLKAINDRLGHAEGDRALVDAAGVLTGTFRASDVIARIGGDEFCVLLTEAASDADLEAGLARLQERLQAHNASARRRYDLSLSVGHARFDPDEPMSIGELMERADRVMYENKERGLRTL